jgi:hypothetical protein
VTHSTEPTEATELPAPGAPVETAADTNRARSSPEHLASPVWARPRRIRPLTREDRQHHQAVLLDALRGWTLPRPAR